VALQRFVHDNATLNINVLYNNNNNYGPEALMSHTEVLKHWQKLKALNPPHTKTMHTASTSTRWHFAFALCCHRPHRQTMVYISTSVHN